LSDWEAAYAIAGINNPQFQKNPGRYRVHTVAIRKAPVSTIGGICIKPDLLLEELSAAICGATASLARGRLLDNRQHTSNAREYLAATQYTGAELIEIGSVN